VRLPRAGLVVRMGINECISNFGGEPFSELFSCMAEKDVGV
jgi:hypothetical protein